VNGFQIAIFDLSETTDLAKRPVKQAFRLIFPIKKTMSPKLKSGPKPDFFVSKQG